MESEGKSIAPLLVPVHRVPVGTITIWEITEEELRDIERGNPDNPKFGIGLALLMFGLGSLVTLLSADNDKIGDRAFYVHASVIVASLALGGVLLLLWWMASRNRHSAIEAIRARRKAPVVVEVCSQ